MIPVSSNPAAGPAPMVSVLMLAYNHERYLAGALDSVLMQRTSFPFEIVIGEDASTDGSRAIVQSYASRFPGVIRPLFRASNLGTGRNYADTLAHCRGKYIAYLEGDDQWTFPEKLQRQVEFLEAHPDHSLCFHDVAIIDENGRETSPNFRPITATPGALDVPDILSRNPVPTCSAMSRRSILPSLPPEFEALSLGDWPTWLLLAARGKVAYHSETWAAYRVHSAAHWSTLDLGTRYLRVADFLVVISRLLGAEPHPMARSWAQLAAAREKRHLDEVIGWLVRGGRWREARPVVRRYLARGKLLERIPPRGRRALYFRVLLGWPSAPMREWAAELVAEKNAG
jgi:glycosyltransferase involved in cell wall biosynthesis